MSILEDGSSPPATVDSNVASMELPMGLKKKDVSSPKKSNPYIKKNAAEQKKSTLAILRLRAQGDFDKSIPV